MTAIEDKIQVLQQSIKDQREQDSIGARFGTPSGYYIPEVLDRMADLLVEIGRKIDQ